VRFKIDSKNLLKAVVKTHRLLGFFLCLLFVIWCLSGFVMMYKGFPTVSDEDRAKLNKSIDLTMVAYPLNIESFIDMDSIKALKLIHINKQAVFNIETLDESVFNFTANKIGEKLKYDENDVRSILYDYYKTETVDCKIETITELDQWIPRTRYLPHMPIFRVDINDNEGTVWYVSSKTGEVLQKLDFSDKVWAWLGAIPHWLYFKDIRINTPLWQFIVITLSFIGVLLSIAGIVLGINRYLIARKRNQLITPYKKKWFKWHHYLGFTFGLFTFTWVLSGLFSMNPLKWSPSNSLSENQLVIWEGESTLKSEFNEANFDSFIKQNSTNDSIFKIDFNSFNGNVVAVLNTLNGTRESNILNNHNTAYFNKVDLNLYVEKISELYPKNKIVNMFTLSEYDDYYYSRTNTLPLPIYKYELNDEGNTALYIDPLNHQVVRKVETKNRVERWIYHGLHSFDFAALRNKRPLWDIVVILFLTGVTLLSISGAVLTYKKLFGRRK